MAKMQQNFLEIDEKEKIERRARGLGDWVNAPAVTGLFV
jgi:hypothetical protein